MHSRTLPSTVMVLAFVLLFGVRAGAQSAERVGETWNGQNSSLIMRALIMRALKGRQAQRPEPAPVDLSVVTFKPAGDSGVAKALADALGGNPQERAALTQAFLQIKQGYEAEVAKEGKANNLAAAFTFFIAANVMTYRQSEPPEKATDTLFGELQKVIAGVPEFTRMSNPEKQRVHDWLVCMAGFAMAGYADARQAGDSKGLDTYRDFADYSLRLVFGIEAGKLNFRGEQFFIEGDAAPSQPPGAAGQKLVGVWGKSASSPWGLSPGAMMTNAGYYKGQYQFGADGSYSFKGESWGGYSRSDEFWTIIESGVYSVDGDALTISPRASTATLRNRAGAVKDSRNNQLEKVTYKWRLHYFDGIGEMNLVLLSPHQTARDGAFAGNSDFPNSYLYGQDKNLEWRF